MKPLEADTALEARTASKETSRKTSKGRIQKKTKAKMRGKREEAEHAESGGGANVLTTGVAAALDITLKFSI